VPFTLKKLECLKQANLALNKLAWDNRIGHNDYFIGSSDCVMINRDCWAQMNAKFVRAKCLKLAFAERIPDRFLVTN